MSGRAKAKKQREYGWPDGWSYKICPPEEGMIEIFFDDTGDGVPDAEVAVSQGNTPDEDEELFFEALAAARLITAAPEMAEALREAKVHVFMHMGDNALHRKICALLARVEGKE